jgi:hypothetical protein
LNGAEPVHLGGDVKKGLGAEKETGARALVAAGEAQAAVQVGLRRTRRELEIF